MFSRLLVFIFVMTLCASIGTTSIAQLSQSKFIQNADYDGYFLAISKAELLAVGQIGAMTVFKIAVTGRDTLIKSSAHESTNKKLVAEPISLLCGSDIDHLGNSTINVIHAEELTC